MTGVGVVSAAAARSCLRLIMPAPVGTLPGMTEPVPTPGIQVPPLPPERLAEVRALFERVARGDESGLVSVRLRRARRPPFAS
jgi:hypothetical protein